MRKIKNIHLEIRSFSSPDVEFDSWEPTTNTEVYFAVEMEIGQSGVDGADLFQVLVATPESLRAKAKTGIAAIAVRSTIVVSHYDWNDIRNVLEAIVRKCESDTWVTSTLRLQRYFEWEYEDFQIEGAP